MSLFSRIVRSTLAAFLLGLILICSTCWADDLLYDGFDDLAKMQREVREVTEVQRHPLFDNAPFLHLREGDKLVKAKEARERGKPSPDPDRISYYLFSAGKYYLLWTDETDGTLELSPAFYSANACLLFDWEATLANAQALRKLLPNEFAGSIPRTQYDTIMHAISRQFPEFDDTIDTFPGVRSDRLVSIPGHVAFEFQGISYELFSHCFYRYTIRIGPQDCQITGRLLLRGPRHVQRWEFERVIL